MVRADWLNLNGLWDYAVTNASAPSRFDGKILVPFPIESALSGVMTPLDAKNTLWYQREFTLPKDWAGRRILLHFGAVDWACRVFINGRAIGEHHGGYDHFTFDITPYLKTEGPQRVQVAVTDPTEGDQPRGKQSRKPEGIFYTQVSGIWQTVWLEPVSETSIQSLQLTPDGPGQALRVRVNIDRSSSNLTFTATARAGGRVVGRTSGAPNTDCVLALPDPHWWTPADPFLYDLTVTAERDGRQTDTVNTYFAMRQVAVRKGADGFMRIELNGQPLFELGALDQGFWPDGLYTAPTDEALKNDIAFLKAAGFNLVRKHVKVEPDRWYYWCDRLGLLVWQDMPSANNNTRSGRIQFESELLRMIEQLRNHPSIVMWVLFNEGWGQYDTEKLTGWIKQMDPSRLVDDASGWTDAQSGDIIDTHSYPDPDAAGAEEQRASVLGETGGLGLVIDGHSWPQPWAYQMLPDEMSLQGWYSHERKEIEAQRVSRGLSGAVFTQLTDVENECNGLMTYDRAVAKLSAEWLRRMNTDLERGPWKVILPDALSGGAEWKYTFDDPGGSWTNRDYKPGAGWKTGKGGFGTGFTRGAHVETVWDTANIWLHREFVIEAGDIPRARLQLHHDKDAEVYLNGVPAFLGKSYLVDYAVFAISPEALAALHPGTNDIAVHCHQTAGGQFIDVGILTPETKSATAAAGR